MKCTRLSRFILVLTIIIFIFNIICTIWYQHRSAEANANLAQCKRDVYNLQRENDELREALSVYQNTIPVEDPAPPRYLNVPLNLDLQKYIYSLCSLYGISDHYLLVYAIIQQESNFIVDIVSKSNDYGLMQINVVNHEFLSEQLGITNFLDPFQNVHAGIYLLSIHMHKYNDVPQALMAYNMGAGGAAKLWSRGIQSTYYTEQVLQYYSQFTEDI